MTDVERFKRIISEMADLFEKKNANYGNSFEKLFNELGPISGLVPLHNKLDRATNLVKGGHNDFESLQDTFIDLANYAIMNVIQYQKMDEEKSTNKKSDKQEKTRTKKVILNEEIPADNIAEEEIYLNNASVDDAEMKGEIRW